MTELTLFQENHLLLPRTYKLKCFEKILQLRNDVLGKSVDFFK